MKSLNLSCPETVRSQACHSSSPHTSPPMPHRFIAVIDSLMIFLGLSIIAPGGMVLAEEAASGEITELRVLALPLMGAACTMIPMIIFRLRREPMNILVGRGMMALFFGAVLNVAASLLLPQTAAVLTHPIMLFFGGGVASIVSFAVIHGVVRLLEIREHRYAQKILDAAERHLPNHPHDHEH
jgi:hypothetical protein